MRPRLVTGSIECPCTEVILELAKGVLSSAMQMAVPHASEWGKVSIELNNEVNIPQHKGQHLSCIAKPAPEEVPPGRALHVVRL